MLHRETDLAKVERNLETVFDLHGRALEWLEDYTGIDYPFAKLDFVAVPAFQYGGMEHPGAIFYRDRSLFLEETATQNQHLGRASLIAHEVAHMWFGNLVTMKWFDDVWMKEVFANFMAAKIVHPSFPDVDHDLRFLLAHYPAAYEVDRTAGANPIRQELDNLAGAGSLYGAIIYQKAPIVMKHLELLTGDERFRDGLRRYLSDSAFGNATWDDLIGILDALTEEDLATWSRIWVEGAGRPTITTEIELGYETSSQGASLYPVEQLRIVQSDPAERGRTWRQPVTLLMAESDGRTSRTELVLRDEITDLEGAKGRQAPAYVLMNGNGVGYGYFELDAASRDYLLRHLDELPDPRLRAIAWLSLWDGMLEGTVPVADLLELALRLLAGESDELNIQRLLTDLRVTYWRFLDADQRREIAPRLEGLLWNGVLTAEKATLTGAWFGAYRDLASTNEAIERLERVWRGLEVVDGLVLSENDTTLLAQHLALRRRTEAEHYLGEQRQEISNPDRLARFDFVAPALASDPEVRDAFFAGLAEPSNRDREPWVLEALGFLHHPLASPDPERYLPTSLDLLEEIQRTGDIFFPLGWLRANLDGHASPEAADIVQDFLDSRPDLPERLRGKVLQAADPLFRAARLRGWAR